VLARLRVKDGCGVINKRPALLYLALAYASLLTHPPWYLSLSGSLPGGVDAEALQKLTENQELMALMANDKLQVGGCVFGLMMG